MTKRKTVTIGIPAYDEEANIKNLLKSLLVQKGQNFILERIIVISDGSSDNTIAEAGKVKNNLIELINHKKNLGKIRIQNEILKKSKSDILIILDADVIPSGKNFNPTWEVVSSTKNL